MKSGSKFVGILFEATRFVVMVNNMLGNFGSDNSGFIVNSDVLNKRQDRTSTRLRSATVKHLNAIFPFVIATVFSIVLIIEQAGLRSTIPVLLRPRKCLFPNL